MSHATLPITSVLRPTRRVAAVLAVLAVIAIAAVLVVRTIDGNDPKPIAPALSAVPAQAGPAPASGTRPDGGPDESRVAVAVSGR
jgi:hypothetical protein